MAVAEREIIAAAQEDAPKPFRWTTRQFYEMGERGLFKGEKVILIEGEVLAMPPIKPPHQTGVSLVSEAVRAAFGEGFFVREQGPFDVNEATDPEPDIAVVFGGIRDYITGHPSQAALIVEVSFSTLAYDRYNKASLYAMAGIAEYWIINIDSKPAQLEVHRQPVPDESQPHGFRYSEHAIYLAGDIIQPLNSPKPVAVAALLP